MNLRTSLSLSLLCLISCMPVMGMKKLNKQLYNLKNFNVPSFKKMNINPSFKSVPNIINFSKKFELEENKFSISSSSILENKYSTIEKSKNLSVAIKNNSGYKGFDKNAKFYLYNNTKRNFHTNKQLQGPAFGWFMYCATKTVLYALPIAAGSAAVAATGGAASGAGASLVAKTGTAAATAGLTAATASVPTAVAATAAAITTDVVATAVATQATAATVAATGGCVATYITFVEGCAAAVGAVCGMAPTL